MEAKQNAQCALTLDEETLLRCFLEEFDGPQPRRELLEKCLRWSLGDDAATRSFWSRAKLQDSAKNRKLDLKHPIPKSRDEYVLALWQSIRGTGGINSTFLSELEVALCPRHLLDRAVFFWFLRRFDLVRALNVYFHSRGALLHACVIAPALTLATLAITFPTKGTEQVLMSLLGFIVPLVGVWAVLVKPKKMAFIRFFDSLLPRLGAGVAVGYLFLFAAPQLVRFIVSRNWLLYELFLFAASSVAFLFLFISSHIDQRVQPPLLLGELVPRVFHILSLGMFYALVALPIFCLILFSASFLGLKEAVVPKLPHYLVCALISLSFGTLLQLVWEEKGLSQPF